MRIRKSFFAQYFETNKKFVLVTGASSAEKSTDKVQTGIGQYK